MANRIIAIEMHHVLLKLPLRFASTERGTFPCGFTSYLSRDGNFEECLRETRDLSKVAVVNRAPLSRSLIFSLT